MLSFIIIVLILSSLFRRPRYWGFPFLGGWGYRRPPMGWHHRPPMGGPHGRRIPGRAPWPLLTELLFSGTEMFHHSSFPIY